VQSGGERIGIEAVIMGDDNIAVIDIHPFNTGDVHSGVFQLVSIVGSKTARVVEGLWHGALQFR